MRHEWLRRNHAPRLIVVFGGWALGPVIFRDLVHDGDGDDVLFIDDYRDLDLAPAVASQIAGYRETVLLAYSFGVASALHWLTGMAWRPGRMVAINGTAFPVDADRGIAPDLLAATAQNLSIGSLARFVRRCGGGIAPDLLAQPGQGGPDGPDEPDGHNRIDAGIEMLRQELWAIAARGPAMIGRFDRIWIGCHDRIISPAAQQLAWAGQSPAIRLIDAPHQPFGPGQKWGDWLA